MAAPSHPGVFVGVHVHPLSLRAGCIIALAVLSPAGTAAQERSEPRLILSAFGGLNGGRHLWAVNRQPFFVLGTEPAPRYDTLRLSRDIRTGLILGFAGTFFRSPTFGVSGEIVFLGLSTDDHCSVPYDSGADPLARNAQLCRDIDAHSISPTSIGFFAGVTYRAFARAYASPYLRGQMGLATRTGSTVATEGAFLDTGPVLRRRAVIADASAGSPVPSAGVALGVMVPFTAGHQFRLELRDQLVPMKRVAGVADALAVAPTSTVLVHGVAFVAGLDIVLERERGRRY